MWIVLAYTSGKFCTVFHKECKFKTYPGVFRANRAQYAEVSFQTVVDDDITDVTLPSMQGVAEDEGVFISPIISTFCS